MNKELITQAFEKLGPERVERGLTATGRGSYEACFWSFALNLEHQGNPVNLPAIQAALAICDEPARNRCTGDLFSPKTTAVSDAWDRNHDEFKALAREWLEAHPPRVLRPTQSVAA